jgi:hypothetical protein
VKLAPTSSVALTVITQFSAVPEQAPVQPSNVSPDDGEAISVTVLPTGNDWEHPLDPVQSIPAGLEVTLPWPPTVTTTVSALVVGDAVAPGEIADADDCPAVVADALGELPSTSVARPSPHPAIKLAKAQTAPNRTRLFISNIALSAPSSMPKPLRTGTDGVGYGEKILCSVARQARGNYATNAAQPILRTD